MLVVVQPDAAARGWVSCASRLVAAPRTIDAVAGAAALDQLKRFRTRRRGHSADQRLRLAAAGTGGLDDVVVLGTPDGPLIEELAGHLRPHGTLCILGSGGLPEVELDIGRIHYEGLQFIGSPTMDLAQAYESGRSAELTPGGAGLVHWRGRSARSDAPQAAP